MKKVGTFTMSIGLGLVFVLLSYITDSADEGFMAIFTLPLIPGVILYVLTTGDIHGWQPGPIGQTGRILVIAFGAWLFWTPILYLLVRRWQRRQS